MRIVLIGYGKMGKMLERLAPEHGGEVVAALDVNDTIGPETLQNADVAIEFTEPDSAVGNIMQLAAAHVPVVVGTTGWLEALPQVEQLVAEHRIGLVHSANYSIGVAVFQRALAETARLLAPHEGYGAYAWEVHHSAKKDAPSGTLLQLTQAMRQAGYTRPIDTASNRSGTHPGTHEVVFDSAADTISLRHTARSREGFAHGALTAARWIIGKQGIYTFSDVLFGASQTEQQPGVPL